METALVGRGVSVKRNWTSQHFGRCIRLHVSISRREGRREGERDTVKGRMTKRSLRTASVLRYSTRTKHYKLNRIWAFGIRKTSFSISNTQIIFPRSNYTLILSCDKKHLFFISPAQNTLLVTSQHFYCLN